MQHNHLTIKLIPLLLLSILIGIEGFSQKTERYSGEYFNGQKVKGEANFSYYHDNKKNKIKNGTFRYSARAKTKQWRYSQNINGEYINGRKTGVWTYTLNSKEKEVDKDGFYYNITVEMDANYKKGIPEGHWNYTCSIYKYQKVEKSGRLRKTNEICVKNIDISLNWKKGKLVDTLIINDKLGTNITAYMNSYGVLIGDFSIINENGNTTISYEKGIEKLYIANTDSLTNIEYSTYQLLEERKTKAKKIKKSHFYKENCIIADYITDNIFSNDYFLYRYIDGDNLLKSDNDYGDYTITYKGLYFYDLQPIPTEEEAKLFKEIEIAIEKTNEASWYNKLALKESPKNKKLLEDKKRVNNAIKSYKNLNCQLSLYKKYLSIKNIKSKSKCKALNFDTPPLIRIDYLHQIKHQSDMIYKNLSIRNQFH